MASARSESAAAASPDTSSSAAPARRLGPGVRVAAVGEDADHVEAQGPAAPRELARPPPGAPRVRRAAAVDLDQDSRATGGSPHRRRDRLRPGRGIHADRQRGIARRGAAAARPSGRSTINRVRDEQVVDPAVGEHLGLADRRHRQPDRAGRQLSPPELEALVRLCVRAQGHATVAHEGRHPGDVGVHPVEVHHDRGRLDPGRGVGVESGLGHGFTSPGVGRPRRPARSWEDTALGRRRRAGDGRGSAERQEGVGDT